MVDSQANGDSAPETQAKSKKEASPKAQLSLSTKDAIEETESVEVEIRGGRTAGALPTSMMINFTLDTTVAEIKTRLAESSDASKKLAPSGIKLVCEGRALDDSDTLMSMVSDPKKPENLTLFAALGTQDNGTKTPQSPFKSSTNRASSLPASPSFSPSVRSTPPSGERGASAPSSPGKIAPPSTPSVPGWEDEMRKKIEMNMKKAFWDSLEAAISTQGGGTDANANADWVVKLYAETRDRLCALTPRREDIRQQIHAALDVQLFERMVTHDAFEPADLLAMVAFTFDRLAALCSPARDGEVRRHRDALSAMATAGGATFAPFAVAYLKAFHETVDNIEADIEAFKQQVQQSQQQTPPPPPASTPATHPPASSSLSSSPSSSSSTRELKDRLRQLGLSEEVIGGCVERRDLEALVQQALGRADGVVSGGALRPLAAFRAAGRASRALDLESEPAEKVPISFSVLAKGAAPAVTQLRLPLSHSIAQAKAALAAALSESTHILPAQLQLVFAGRILGDDEKVEAVYRPDAPGSSVHVVSRSGP